MDKVNEYIKSFDETTRNDDQYVLRHLRERRNLLQAYYHDLYRVHHSLEAIEKRGHYFQEEYDRLESADPPLPEEITEDDIVNLLRDFLSPNYKCKPSEEHIVGGLVWLISCLDFLVKRKITDLSSNVVWALDMAIMDLIGNVATAKSAAMVTGVKRDKNKKAAKPQKKTKNKRRDKEIKPEVIAALEKYLNENSARTIKTQTLNYAIENHISLDAIYSPGTIRKIIIAHYEEKGEEPPFKKHGVKKDISSR